MRIQILAFLSLGVLVAGCEPVDTRQVKSMAAQPAELICANFVVIPNSAAMDQCVDYQKSRDAGPSVPPFRRDEYNNRLDAEGYAVDGTGRRMPVQSPYRTPSGMASSGQVILRDEYGNRYDAKGNRITN